MAQVSVTIAGRPFRMACGDGEEAHLEGLAAMVDQKITELRGAFGEIGDQRLTVMAAISVADELSEVNKKLARLEADVARLREDQEKASGLTASMTEAVAAAIEEAAMRIETVSKSIR